MMDTASPIPAKVEPTTNSLFVIVNCCFKILLPIKAKKVIPITFPTSLEIMTELPKVELNSKPSLIAG